MTETLAPWDVTPPTPVPSTVVATAPPPQISMAGPEALAAAGQANQMMAAEVDRYGLHIETLQAQDALNKLRARREDLTYGPQNGFVNVKGGDVLKKLPDGTSLQDSYKQRFQAVRDDVSSGLSGRGRQMFDQRASAESTGFLTDFAKHQITQTEHYDTQVLKDGLTQDLAEASRNFQDPAKLEEIATRSAGRARNYAMAHGMPADGAALAAQSNIVAVGVKSLLASGAQRQALAYFDQNQDKLDAGDRVQLAAAIKGVASDVVGENVANEALAKAGLPPMPSDDTSAPGVVQKATLHKAIVGQESGGQQFTPAGGVLTSPKGALGIGQITPGTFAQFARPGERIDNKGDNLAVSRRITDHYMEQYGGDWQRAAVAYFSGPGNVAPAGSPTPWKRDASDGSVLTSQYVQQVGQRMGATAGATARAPTPWQGEGDTALPGMPQGLAKGDVKVGFTTAAASVSARTDLNSTEKAKALALINRQSSQVTAFQTAQTQSLDDSAAATLATVIVNPSLLKPGTFSAFADQYAALGQSEKAVRYRLVASMEGMLKEGLGSATDAQLSMLKELAHGLPQQIISAFMSGNAKARAESATLGAEKGMQLKKSIETDAVDPAGLVPLAKEAMAHYAAAAKPEEARKIADYMTSAMEARRVATGNPAAAEGAIADMKAHANKGEADSNRLQALSLASSMFAKQQDLFKHDAFAAGTSIYPQVGAPVPLPTALDAPDTAAANLTMRVQQANQISALRGGITVLPFTQPEIAQIRQQLDVAAPDLQAKIMLQLSALPAESIPHVAAALAGKHDTGDALSRSYAAALSFYAGHTPEQHAVADQILRGARIIKDGGESGRKPAATSDAWQSSLQDRLGNVFQDMGAKVPAVVADAIASVYTYQMARAGRQGEKPDTDVLDKAITTVMGQTITRNGQALLPPQRGMTRYEFDGVLDRLTDGDLNGAKTLEGDPVTTDVVRRRGVLTNIGDGTYMVRVPDPRRGGDLAEIVNPATGRAWTLDGKALMQRAPAASPMTPERDFSPTGPRRAIGNRYLPQPGPTP